MRLLVIGLIVLAVSLTGAAVNIWARDAFPDQWGGPNIGGGMLQLLFYAGTLTGVVLTTVGAVRWRRRSPHGR